MYQALKHAHSGLRWLVLIALVIAIIQAFSNNGNRKISAAAMGLVHLQIIIGIILYFFVSPITKNLTINMKDTISRFYGVEHFVLMIIAAIVITVGNSALKKGKFSKHKWLYLLGLIIILAGIPWPFRIPMAGWF